MANSMRPRDMNRGSLDTGSYAKAPIWASEGKTFYEHGEDIYHAVSENLRQRGGRRYAGMYPLRTQALLWVQGKGHELGHPEAKMSRKRPGEMHSGPSRRGQPYVTESGELAPYS